MDKKKVIFVVLTILLILGGLGAGVYLVQKSTEYREKAAPATTMALTTTTPNPQVGQNVLVNIDINTGVNQIGGVEMNINFDTNILEVQEVSIGDFFTNPGRVGPRFDNSLGTIYLVLYVPPNSILAQGQGTLASINFKTKDVGSATISIAPNTTVSAGESNEPYTPTQGPQNVLIGTTPLTLNVLAAESPTNTPSPTANPTQAAASPSPTNGIGGLNDPTATPTRTPTATPTGLVGSGNTTTTPTPTTEAPPMPDTGISAPVMFGLIGGGLLLAISLFLAL